jgi:GTPase SAR1 family protein
MAVRNDENLIKVGLLGDVYSGKSTYLGSLRPFSLQEEIDSYSILYNDDQTREIFENLGNMLNDGNFPQATLSGGQGEVNFDIRLNNGHSFNIITQDRMGGDFFSNPDPEDYKKVIEYVSQCKGIILLVSVRKKGGDSNLGSRKLDKFFNDIRNKMRDQDREILPFPHRVAVCFTQYDDARFFEYGRQKKMFEIREKYHGLKNVPFIRTEPGNRHYIEINTLYRLLSWFNDVTETYNVLKKYFDLGKINYYALSSIGFNYDSESKEVDWEDCNNVEVTNNREETSTSDSPRSTDIRPSLHIKSSSKIVPIDLIRPFSWIISKEVIPDERLNHLKKAFKF